MMNAPPKARILIVDDHPLVCISLEATIQAQLDLLVLGSTGCATEAMQMIEEQRPDLVIVDISLQGANGLDLIKQVTRREDTHATKFLVVSAHDEALYALRTIGVGAQGYVSKQADLSVILDAVRTVLGGNTYLSASMQERMHDARSKRPGVNAATGIEALSDRELEVYELLGRGVGTSGIAERLGISVKTVETYQANIKKKLKLESGSELTRSAILWTTELEQQPAP